MQRWSVLRCVRPVDSALMRLNVAEPWKLLHGTQMVTLTHRTESRPRHVGERVPERSLSFKLPKEATVTFLPFQILYFEDLSVGMVEAHSKTVKSSDVVGFAEITGDRNPIHLSEHFAAKTPFKGRIAHGLYTASLISAVIGTRLPGPGAIYVSQTLRFLAPVKIGDTVDAIVEVVDLSEQRQRVRLLCTCKVGNTVVLEGEAIVKVPRHQQD